MAIREVLLCATSMEGNELIDLSIFLLPPLSTILHKSLHLTHFHWFHSDGNFKELSVGVLAHVIQKLRTQFSRKFLQTKNGY